MRFDTEITLTGPLRSPKQMLDDQSYDGHASVHDEATTSSLGLRGADRGTDPLHPVRSPGGHAVG